MKRATHPTIHSRNLPRRLRGLAMLAVPLATAVCTLEPAGATDIYKANNATALNAAGSWTNNAVPGASDIAVWDSTVTAANTVGLGGNLSWRGIRVANPGGAVNITTGSTLTLGVGGIDMSAATQDLTLSNAVTIAVGGLQTWNVATGRTLTLAAVPTKPNQPNTANSGGLQISTNGTVVMLGGTLPQPLILDGGNDPFVTLGKYDWAARDANGVVVPAAYTPVSGAMVAGAINDIIGDTSVGTVDVAAERWNDPAPHTLTITGTSTHTARGILVTPDCGGGTIAGPNAFIRPNRVSTAGQSFDIFQNSPKDFTISARFSNASSGAPVHVVKFGPGNLIVSSPFNGHTGGTTVNGGTLTVASGATLSSGSVTVNANARLVLNTGSTFVAGVTNNSGSTNTIQVISAAGQFFTQNITYNAGTARLEFNYNNGVAQSPATAPLRVGTLTNNANSITIDIYSGNMAVGAYPLVAYTNLTGSGFGAFSLGFLPPRVTAVLSNDVATSSIYLVVTAVDQPVEWSAGSGAWDINTTPNWKDPLGAATTYMQFGTLGDAVLFGDVNSGASPIMVTLNIPVSPAAVTVNASKSYTISGSGALAGTGGLTKNGSGTLTLSTVNTFTGGINLNGGVTVFSALENLGGSSSPITFGGGTLQFAPGSIADISLRTVTFGSGGGTIDSGANNIYFVSPIGNSGAGGLRKIGTGSITLTGVNAYSGDTIIGEGAMGISFGSTISNSAVVYVAGGATLDATQSGLILNGVVGQKLAGTGTANGQFTVPAGASISPATNGAVGTLNIGGDVFFSGGNLAVDISTASHDLLVMSGALTLNGGTVQLNVSGTLTNGVYKLIQYSNGLVGSAANMILSGFSQPGQIGSLLDNVTGEIDLVVETAGSGDLVWKGDGAGNVWDVGGPLNWLAGVTPSAFFSGDHVTFTDDGSTTPAVGLAAALRPGGVTVSNTVDYTFADGSGLGNGRLSGSTGIAKSGSGKLTLLVANNNSGMTVINGGTVQVGDGSVTGDIGTGSVSNNGALVFMQTDNRSVAAISGSGSLSQLGSATLTLLKDNTYSGATTIGPGAILQVGTGGALGTLGSGAVQVDGTLTFNRSGNITLTNAVSGAGNLSKIGPATMILANTNTYLGNTFVSNGLMRVTAADMIPHGSDSTGWLILDGGGVAGVFDMNGFNQTVNGLSGLGGTVNGLVTNSGTTGTNTLTIGSDTAPATTTFNGLIAENPSGAKLQLILQGGGNLRLNGANTYSGGTFVNGGTFGIGNSGAAGSAGILFADGTTLNMAASSPSAFPGNTMTFAPAATVSFTSANLANGIAGSIVGDAASTNIITGAISASAANLKQWQDFLGTVIITGAGQLRFSTTSGLNNGGDNTTFEVDDTGSLYLRNAGTATLGALAGNGNVNAPSVSGVGTFIIGTKGIDSTFSGGFNGANNLIKSGPATLTLTGSATYTGTTTISNGVLAIVDPVSLDNSPAIAINSGGTLDVSGRADGTLMLGNIVLQPLTGSGAIRGSLVAGLNSTVAPGDAAAAIGKLTVTNAVTLDGPVTLKINRTNSPNSDQISAGAAITIDGTATLVVTNIGATNFFPGDTFALFNKAVSGAFASVTLPALPCEGLSWTNKLAVDGTIAVIGTPCVNTTPTNITAAFSGNTLTLSWPGDHTGWTLQSQTNAPGAGISTNWVNVPGSADTNQVIRAVDPANGSVFYRLIYP